MTRGRCLAATACFTAASALHAASFTIRSDPAGVLPESQTLHAPGTVVTSGPIALERPELGLSFTHWRLDPAEPSVGCDAIRCVDATGQASTKLRFVLSHDIEATAHYMPSSLDSDSDGLPDALELRSFGNLASGPNDDADGDGIELRDEWQRGSNPRLLDVLLSGGVARSPGERGRVIARDGFVFLYQVSSPPGLVDIESIVRVSQPHALAGTGDATAGHRLGFWTWDGVALRDASGAALMRPVVVPIAESTAQAHFFGVSDDVDGDGIPDWFEYRWSLSLSHSGESDVDGDGVSLQDEFSQGTTPSLANRPRPGGTVRSPSAQQRVSVLPGYLVDIRSQPEGIFPADERTMAPGVGSTPDPPESSGTFRFVHWTVNGVGQRDAAGAALLGPLNFEVATSDLAIRGVYLASTLDADADGLPDWFEARADASGNLDASHDTDGDGVTNLAEWRRGRSVRLAESARNGGVARSPAGPLVKFGIFDNGFEPEQ